ASRGRKGHPVRGRLWLLFQIGRACWMHMKFGGRGERVRLCACSMYVTPFFFAVSLCAFASLRGEYLAISLSRVTLRAKTQRRKETAKKKGPGLLVCQGVHDVVHAELIGVVGLLDRCEPR